MLDKLRPYNLYFIQKASPGEGDAFDYALIYKFYTERTEEYQRLKYIIRIEVFEDVFALKFYAARDRKMEDKYNRIIKAHNYSGVMRIFLTCAFLILKLHEEFPTYSFVINGAESNDLEGNKVEGKNSTQRFRIYRIFALQVFGREKFEHYQYPSVSSYMLVNRNGDEDIESKAERIKDMFIQKGFDMM